MTDSMRVEVNPDGTATATVGAIQKTFSDLNSAVAWATEVLYGLEGEECG